MGNAHGHMREQQRREEAAERARRDRERARVETVVERVRTLQAEPPVNVAVLGLQHHGKSSLINTALRVLNREYNGPWIQRAETGVPSAEQTTRICTPYDTPASVKFFDTPSVHNFDSQDVADMQAILAGHQNVPIARHPFSKTYNPKNKAEVVVLVFDLQELESEGNKAIFQKLVNYLRDPQRPGGPLRVIIVASHADKLNDEHEVADGVQSLQHLSPIDLVIPMQLYTAENSEQRLIDTELKILQVVEQAIVYALADRATGGGLPAVGTDDFESTYEDLGQPS